MFLFDPSLVLLLVFILVCIRCRSFPSLHMVVPPSLFTTSAHGIAMLPLPHMVLPPLLLPTIVLVCCVCLFKYTTTITTSLHIFVHLGDVPTPLHFLLFIITSFSSTSLLMVLCFMIHRSCILNRSLLWRQSLSLLVVTIFLCHLHSFTSVKIVPSHL